MKESFKSAIKDPFIQDMIKVATLVVAFLIAAVGFKMLKQYFKK